MSDLQVRKQAENELRKETRTNKNNNGRSGCLASAVIRMLSMLVCLAVFVGISNGKNWLHQNDVLQRKADISLNEWIEQGQELTPESYVSFDVRWVVGPYAEETHTRNYSVGDRSYSSSKTDSGVEAVEAVDYFYYVVLEDWTIMTLKASAKAEVEKLNQLSEWLLSVDGYPMDGETFTVYGKLEDMPSGDIRSFYNEYLSIFGFSSNDPEVRYLMLDTTEGRYGAWLLTGLAVLLVVVIVLIVKQVKRNKQEQNAEATYSVSENQAE